MSFERLKSIFGRFQHVQGTIISAAKYGSGHINDTYRIRLRISLCDEEGYQEKSYILQRINHEVFTRPVEVMENVALVTAHLREKITLRGGDPYREALTLVPTIMGEPEKYFVKDLPR